MNHLQSRLAFVAPLLCSLAFVPLSLLPVPSEAAELQGSGHRSSETRSVAEFQAVALAGAMELVVRQGAQQSLQVQADDNLLPLLETVVESGSQGPTLQIRWKRGSDVNPRAKVLVTAVMPQLTRLSAAGSGGIRLETFSTPSLHLTLSGAGNVQLDSLTAEMLNVRVAGSGDVAGSGKAGKLSINIAGSGDVRLPDLRADDVHLRIAGSGDATVHAQKTLDVSIAGSGDVSYTGNPVVTRSVAGSGSVTRR